MKLVKLEIKEKDQMDKLQAIKELLEKEGPKMGERCGYESMSDKLPEDLCEERTDWDSLRDYADEMMYRISDMRGLLLRIKDIIDAEGKEA